MPQDEPLVSRTFPASQVSHALALKHLVHPEAGGSAVAVQVAQAPFPSEYLPAAQASQVVGVPAIFPNIRSQVVHPFAVHVLQPFEHLTHSLAVVSS